MDPVVGRQIDCTSYYENESEEFKRKGIELTPELWLVKLLVGSIDPSYDEQVSFALPLHFICLTTALCGS